MRPGALILLLIFVICCAGCVTPVPLSTMGSTAGSSAPVAFNTEGGGRGESFWLAKYEDVVAAALRAGQALSLELAEKREEGDQTFIRFIDDTGERVDLIIERRTEKMTAIKFRVGWWGSVAFGRLLARQIIHELKESKSFLEDYYYETQK